MPGPVLAVFNPVRPPSVQLALPDGLTAEGLPYVSFDSQIPAGGLPSGATSQPATLAFANPQQMRFDVEVTLLAAANTAPVFSSSPLVFVTPQTAYQYAASAQDAELDLLTFGLDAAPSGMTVDPSTGLVSWYPTADQVGTHAIQLRVSDGRGGSAVQQYSLQVATVVNDVAPLITSRPPLLATVGEPYQYALAVQDPNDTQFSFQLLADPGDMAIDTSTGIVRPLRPHLVTWVRKRSSCKWPTRRGTWPCKRTNCRCAARTRRPSSPVRRCWKRRRARSTATTPTPWRPTTR